jgi:hypothetical protein
MVKPLLFYSFQKNKKPASFSAYRILSLEATPGFEPGMKVLQTSTLPLGYIAIKMKYGAGNEIRTRDVHLGKVTLYH